MKVELLLSPELPARVQTFAVTSVPEPPEALRQAAERLVGALAPADGRSPVTWPMGLAIGPDVDLAAVTRSLAAAAARFAPLALGPVVDGDGERKATWRLRGERGHVDLALTFDPATSCVAAVSLAPPKATLPNLD